MKGLLLTAIISLTGTGAIAEEKQYWLSILFSTPAQRAPHEHPSFPMRKKASLDDCLKSRAHTQNWLEVQAINTGTLVKAFCVEITIRGYEEAFAEFSRMIGDPA